jgi:hypothetical protein
MSEMDVCRTCVTSYLVLKETWNNGWLTVVWICSCPLFVDHSFITCISTFLDACLNLSWSVGHICPTYKESFQVRWDNSIPLFFSMLPSTLKYLYSVEPVRMHFPAKQPYTNDTWNWFECAVGGVRHTQTSSKYHLYSTAVSRENAFWLVRRNRDTSK